MYRNNGSLCADSVGLEGKCLYFLFLTWSLSVDFDELESQLVNEDLHVFSSWRDDLYSELDRYEVPVRLRALGFARVLNGRRLDAHLLCSHLTSPSSSSSLDDRCPGAIPRHLVPVLLTL